jgi:hypothetical protein
MAKPKCNEKFLVSTEVAIGVRDCNNLTVDDKKSLADIGRSIAEDKASRMCPGKCPEISFVSDHQIILRECKDSIQEATYEGYFICLEKEKKETAPKEKKEKKKRKK